MTTSTNATGGHIAGRERAPDVAAPTGKRLIRIPVVERKTGMDARTIYRYADAGLMPWGVKVGALRLWDEGAIDSWIDQGCPKVRQVRNGGGA